MLVSIACVSTFPAARSACELPLRFGRKLDLHFGFARKPFAERLSVLQSDDRYRMAFRARISGIPPIELRALHEILTVPAKAARGTAFSFRLVTGLIHKRLELLDRDRILANVKPLADGDSMLDLVRLSA